MRTGLREVNDLFRPSSGLRCKLGITLRQVELTTEALQAPVCCVERLPRIRFTGWQSTRKTPGARRAGCDLPVPTWGRQVWDAILSRRRN